MFLKKCITNINYCLFSGVTAETAFKYLKKCFYNEKRQLALDFKSGSKASNRKPWSLFECMKFLDNCNAECTDTNESSKFLPSLYPTKPSRFEKFIKAIVPIQKSEDFGNTGPKPNEEIVTVAQIHSEPCQSPRRETERSHFVNAISTPKVTVERNKTTKMNIQNQSIFLDQSSIKDRSFYENSNVILSDESSTVPRPGSIIIELLQSPPKEQETSFN